MSVEPIDLAAFGAWVSRPDASPAPTSGPGDPPIPTGPWAPTVAFKACGCGVLAGEQCDCEALLEQLKTAPVIAFSHARFTARRTPGFRKSTVKTRFFANVRIPNGDGCMEWTGYRIANGYGRMKTGGRSVLAHRLAYELFIGPVPEGMQLDHLCRNRRCVRPDHLEPVTPRENTLRGEGLTAQYAKRTHCTNGHPLSGENVRVTRRGRMCRQCARDTNARYKARKRGAGVAS